MSELPFLSSPGRAGCSVTRHTQTLLSFLPAQVKSAAAFQKGVVMDIVRITNIGAKLFLEEASLLPLIF